MGSVSGARDGPGFASAGSSWDLGSLAASETGTWLAATTTCPSEAVEPPDTEYDLPLFPGKGALGFGRVPGLPWCHERPSSFNLRPRKAMNSAQRPKVRLVISLAERNMRSNLRRIWCTDAIIGREI